MIHPTNIHHPSTHLIAKYVFTPTKSYFFEKNNSIIIFLSTMMHSDPSTHTAWSSINCRIGGSRSNVTPALTVIPGGGGTPWNFWWGCAARISKSRPNFRTKIAIFHTRFQTWRAFLKSPENFSGPKTFRGCLRARFSGSGKRFSKRPIFSRDFRGCFREM